MICTHIKILCIYKTKVFGDSSLNALKNKIFKIKDIEQNISGGDFNKEKRFNKKENNKQFIASIFFNELFLTIVIIVLSFTRLDI